MNVLYRIGRRAIERLRRVSFYCAVMAAVFKAAARPAFWKQPVRDVLARQILFTGFEAVPFIATIAVMVGLALVLQVQLWLGRLGQSAAVGPLLVAIVVREAGPLLTNMIVIGRSGTAMSSELGSMRAAGEVHTLEAQGIEPFLYLVVPRVIGMALSVFCLCLLFVAAALVSGYLLSLLLNVQPLPPMIFFGQVMGAVQPVDIVNIVGKTLIPGLFTGSICCVHGLSVERSLTEIPQAVTRSLVGSMTALFIVSILISVVSYI